MALDALRGYVALASGLTEVTKAKAKASAKALLDDETLSAVMVGGQKAQVQVQALADEIFAAGRANRELLKGLVQNEVDRVVGVAGAASGTDVEELRSTVDRLERRVAILESELAARTASARTASGRGNASTAKPAKKAAAKKTAAKKASAPPTSSTKES